MRLRRRSWVAVLIAALSSLQAVGRPCAGGDGPIPFLNLTGSMNFPVKSITTTGAVREFVHWEDRDALVYRNDRDELRVAYGTGSDVVLGKLTFPLSRIVDENENFLLSEQGSWVLDTAKPYKWHDYWSYGPSPRKLFWKDDDLYLFRTHRPLLIGALQLQIWRYTAGSKDAVEECSYTPPSNAHLHVADGGHAYPYLYLYQMVETTPGSRNIAFYRMNVLSCDVTSLGLPSENLTAKVEEVHRFESMDAFAVKLDHPVMNIRWESPTRCEYFDLDNRRPLIPSHDRPLLVTWDDNKGMSLFNVETMKKADAFRAIGIKTVTDRDLWLPKGDSQLLMSPEMEKTKVRQMLEVDIQDLVP